MGLMDLLRETGRLSEIVHHPETNLRQEN